MATNGMLDCIVIGGGISGARAADLVSCTGASVVLLEANTRLGGRIYSHELYSGVVTDKGAAWVCDSQSHWMDLARELGVTTMLQPMDGKGTIILQRGLRTKSLVNVEAFGGLLPTFNPVEIIALQLALWKLDAMASEVDLNAPWACPHAEQWDDMSAGDWIAENVWTGAAREVLLSSFAGIMLRPPSDISLLWLLFYIRSAGGCRALVDDAQQYRVVEGTQAVVERLCDRVRLQSTARDAVRLNSPVQEVAWHYTDVVTVTLQSGEVLSARAVIVALGPLSIKASGIAFHPPVGRQPHLDIWYGGSGYKFALTYPRRFWKDAGHSGMVCESTTVPWIFDGSPPSGSAAVLSGFVLQRPLRGSEAPAAMDTETRDAQGELLRDPASREARQAQAVDIVAHALRMMEGSPASAVACAREASEYIEMDWTQQGPWLAGCVNGIAPGGNFVKHGKAFFQRQEGRLSWAGAESALVWNGYMEGALRAAEAAARCAGETLVGDGRLDLDGAAETELVRLMRNPEVVPGVPFHRRCIATVATWMPVVARVVTTLAVVSSLRHGLHLGATGGGVVGAGGGPIYLATLPPSSAAAVVVAAHLLAVAASIV